MQALEEHNIAYEEVTGVGMTAHARAQAMDRFRLGPAPVLLMSQVASVGLNIAFANIVILVVSY